MNIDTQEGTLNNVKTNSFFSEDQVNSPKSSVKDGETVVKVQMNETEIIVNKRNKYMRHLNLIGAIISFGLALTILILMIKFGTNDQSFAIAVNTFIMISLLGIMG